MHSVRGLSAATISVYLASVRSLHIDSGFPDPLKDTSRLHRVLRGIRRSRSARRPTRLPITRSVLAAIQAALSADSYDHSMFWAVCSLAFFGFLRVSEFTCSGSFDPLVHLSISDVSFDTSGCLHLFIKTSSSRRGLSLSIGASGKRICAVSAVRRYLQVRGNAPGPLFVLSDGSPITPVVVNCSLLAILSNLGIRCTYSSHSFRIGTATTAASAGIPDHLIKTLGRWPSNAYLLYIRIPSPVLTSIAAVLA